MRDVQPGTAAAAESTVQASEVAGRANEVADPMRPPTHLETVDGTPEQLSEEDTVVRTRRRMAGALLASTFALSLAVAPGHAYVPNVAGGTVAAPTDPCRSTLCHATEHLAPTMGTMPTWADDTGSHGRADCWASPAPNIESDRRHTPLVSMDAAESNRGRGCGGHVGTH